MVGLNPYLYYPVRTSVEGLVWPAVPSRRGTEFLSLLYQLRENEWLPAEEVRRRQYLQASSLAAHAAETVPFYRQRLAAAGIAPGQPLGPEDWRRIPLLTREDIQAQGEELGSRSCPEGNGKTTRMSTSGSTGKPVVVVMTERASRLWGAITLRDHIWHRRDLWRKFVAIRKIKGHDTRDRRSASFDSWQSPVRSSWWRTALTMRCGGTTDHEE